MKKSFLIQKSLFVATLLLLTACPEDDSCMNLKETKIVDGIPCTKEACREDDKLESCFLGKDHDFNPPVLPKHTEVFFDKKVRLESAFLSEDTVLNGVKCRKAGSDHGYQTAFHPNGVMSFCNLPEPTVVEGVPCEKSNFWIWSMHGPAGIEFHDNAKLRGCLLSEDFKYDGVRHKKHTRIEFDENGDLVGN